VTDERCLRDPYFWEMFLPMFCNEKMVLEFSRVSGIPADHIRAAREDYFNNHVRPYLHRSSATH